MFLCKFATFLNIFINKWLFQLISLNIALCLKQFAKRSFKKVNMLTNNEINALYDLDEQSKQLLNNLRQIILTSKELGCTLDEDADDLYMRLRVVLGAIEQYAFNNDEEAQYEADPSLPFVNNAPLNPMFQGAQRVRNGQDY